MTWRAPGGNAAGPYGRDDYAWRDRPRRPPARQAAGRGRGKRRSRARRLLKGLAVTVVTVVVVIALGIGVLWAATPSAGDATRIAADQARQHGIAYPGPAVPATFSNALIATEDHRYLSEQGVDPVAVIRLISSKITGDASNSGGATLEQQLAKMLYTPGRSGVAAEVKQVVMAYKLDGAYNKNQILDLYAEVAYYGHGYYGLEAASCGYFGRPASGLTPLQGAMLAGAVNAPTYDDPINYPRQAAARLTHVIDRMIQVGDLTAEQGKQLLNSSLGIVPRDQAGCS
ncbi:MAG: transglycosylase domain-containing protein [Nocardiopsaceae bacterium]|nr:transglycosylase domain-containing protein [Nocardiopsaceae bacterium]